MAAPITHIAITQKVFAKHLADKRRPDFFVGTVFPDIRYLGIIERDKTHLRVSDIAEVQAEESSFLAGVKFHDLIDWLRNQFLIKNERELIRLLTKNKLIPANYKRSDLIELNRVSKLLEDELVYEEVDNWQKYITYLDEVYSGELRFGVDEKEIRKWHKMLQSYFSQPPNRQLRSNFFGKMHGWTEERITKMEEKLRQMKQVKPLTEFLKSFYNQVNNMITD